MPNQAFYYDDIDEGLSRDTSHPNFVSKLTEEFYYDVLDDFSPFGNDDGADTLFELQDWYRKTKGKKDIMQWLFKYIDGMGFKYSSKDCSALIIDAENIAALQEEDPLFIRTMDNCIIAAAFGQYKISGQLDSSLKDAALTSFKRLKIIAGIENTLYPDGSKENYTKMEADLESLS